MVGRELLTMCPDGEDHQGHDWGETEVVYMVYTSRGMMMNEFKSLVQKTKIIFYDTTHVMLMTRVVAFIPMNFYLTV